MPPHSLKAARKAAAHCRNVSRSEAGNLSERTGLPYLHVGEERYARLDDVLIRTGIDHTVTLGEDRRSPMRWPAYPNAVEAVLILSLTSDQDSYAPYDLDPNHRGSALIVPLADIVLPDDAPPMLAASVQVARDVQQVFLSMKNPASPDYNFPVTGPMLRRLLELAATACAALFLSQEEDIDPMRLRQTVTSVLFDPRAIVESIDQKNAQSAEDDLYNATVPDLLVWDDPVNG